MNEISLHPYLASDRPALRALAAEIVAEGRVFPFEDVAGVEGYWFRPDGIVVVARDAGGTVVGSYAMHPNQAGRGAHVANAGYMVAVRARGRGIGEGLGRHSIAAARAAGYRAMQFNNVVATNTSAIRLWKRLGFVEIGRSPGAFRHPDQGFVDVLILHRPLS